LRSSVFIVQQVNIGYTYIRLKGKSVIL